MSYLSSTQILLYYNSTFIMLGQRGRGRKYSNHWRSNISDRERGWQMNEKHSCNLLATPFKLMPLTRTSFL